MGLTPLHKDIIIKSAKDNRLEPELVAAILLAELSDLWIDDRLGDIPAAIIGDSTVGIGQMAPSTVAVLRPNFGKMKRVWHATRPTKAIPLVAAYIRAVADQAPDLPLDEFYYHGFKINVPDFQKHSAEWDPTMIEVAGFNYTQTPWLMQENNNRLEFYEKPRAGAYGDFVYAKYRELKGKFTE